MSIALLQLASVQNDESRNYVVDEEQPSNDITFFKTTYEKHVGFWWNNVMLRCIPQIELGSHTEAIIAPIHGNFLCSLTLIVQLAPITVSEDTLFRFRYARWLGHAIIRDVALTIDGMSIEHIDGEAMLVKAYVDDHQVDTLRRVSEGNTEPRLYSSNGPVTLHVPLQFDALREPWPIGAMANSIMRVAMRFNSSKNVITQGPTHSVQIDQESYIDLLANQYELTGVSDAIRYISSSEHDLSVNVVIDIIHAEQNTLMIHFNFCQGDATLLTSEAARLSLTHVRFDSLKGSASSITIAVQTLINRNQQEIEVKLEKAELLATYAMEKYVKEEPLNLPGISAIDHTSSPVDGNATPTDTVVNSVATNTATNATTTNTNATTTIARTSPINAVKRFMFQSIERLIYQSPFQPHISVKPPLQHPCTELWIILDVNPSRTRPLEDALNFRSWSQERLLQKLTMELNGRVEYESNEGGIESGVMAWTRRHTNRASNHLKDVHIISFALHPSDAQPSGSLNMRKIDSIQITMKLVSNVDAALIPRLRIRIYARQLRFLEITNDRARPLF